jgi:hypothetical protein
LSGGGGGGCEAGRPGRGDFLRLGVSSLPFPLTRCISPLSLSFSACLRPRSDPPSPFLSNPSATLSLAIQSSIGIPPYCYNSSISDHRTPPSSCLADTGKSSVEYSGNGGLFFLLTFAELLSTLLTVSRRGAGIADIRRRGWRARKERAKTKKGFSHTRFFRATPSQASTLNPPLTGTRRSDSSSLDIAVGSRQRASDRATALAHYKRRALPPRLSCPHIRSGRGLPGHRRRLDGRASMARGCG